MDTTTVRISPRARDAHRAIQALVEANKPVLPTQRDVARKLKVSHERARQLCQELRAAGLVDWIPKAERTLHVTAPLPPAPPAPRRNGKKRPAQRG